MPLMSGPRPGRVPAGMTLAVVVPPPIGDAVVVPPLLVTDPVLVRQMGVVLACCACRVLLRGELRRLSVVHRRDLVEGATELGTGHRPF
eukprot:CAMPEP_0119387078 /NCGR_PEP_ID=MMETSP1334-20130426/99086_1 /TAXON_ID=127549 /ORGANISM="Calcidiscus leptoporus, Strain RCC1130" /LENGTH=88 /DNA_ID=CAMNT_0007408723 /DNA_START=392 /DNA_END=655 /DNA_ORIENTATION=-